MNKSFGISALALAILAVIVPVAGPWMTLIVAGLAAFSGGTGFVLGLSAIILSVINVVALSPTIWLAAASGHSFGTFLVVVQVAAAVALFFNNKKFAVKA